MAMLRSSLLRLTSRSLGSLRPAVAASSTGRYITTGTPLSYEYILTEKKGDQQNVGLIKLNRPRALNALCDGLMAEVTDALKEYDSDSTIGAIVITGSEKAFAAGADIAEMQNMTFVQCFKGAFLCKLYSGEASACIAIILHLKCFIILHYYQVIINCF